MDQMLIERKSRKRRKHNRIELTSEGVIKMELTQGQYALLDKEDYDRVKQHTWHASKSYKGFMAVAYLRYGAEEKTVLMHRIILGLSNNDKARVDHINDNTLDNSRRNLRLLNLSQLNWKNRKCKSKKTSKYKGVSWFESKHKWRAYISFKRNPIYLGLYATEIEAASAYDKKAVELHGEFARLNFPKPLQVMSNTN